MTIEEFQALESILYKKPWEAAKNLGAFLKTVVVSNVEEEVPEKRTKKQNNALHKYLSDLANALTEAGVGVKLFIEKLRGWDVPVTAEFLKQIWHIKQDKMFQTESTTKLTTAQVSQVYDAINLFTSQEFGVSEAFPSMEQIMIKSQEEKGYEYPDIQVSHAST